MTVAAKHACPSETFLSRPLRLLIDGEWVDAQSGETFEFEDPSTGEVIGSAAAAGPADIDRAVVAARRAFDSGPWPAMPAVERARLMNRLADLIDADADELARLESLDGGNPLRSTRHVDIAGAAGRLRYNAGWTNKIFGDTMLMPPASDAFLCSIREPLGVVGAITPWNAPFFMAVGKIALAVAAGCTVVLKPAELTPASAIRLGELIVEAGFPRGVVNIVTGFGNVAGQALVDHPDVDKIAFTGSTAVGRSILACAAKTMKRVTLELGGKSPVIIFPDADVDTAARAAAMGAVFKTGQFCAAGTRIFAHRDIFDRVVELMATTVGTIKVGPALAADTEMGPIVSRKQRDRVLGFVEAGRADGAEIACGGSAIDAPGYFVAPTVLANTHGSMSVMREEIFGPVLCVTRFDTDQGLDPIVAMANDTHYGLAARVWTRDLGTAHRLVRRIKAGSVSVNGAGGAGAGEGLPFGGFKQSGIGREGGHDGIESYTELKTVAIGY
ncbi:MAG: betaine-aldehyde dehydrogenase [Alphaproteobacteria bacterium]|nr:betaine-aldehyde dehydrogenase [Alphaproteobacteria bacterium]